MLTKTKCSRCENIAQAKDEATQKNDLSRNGWRTWFPSTWVLLSMGGSHPSNMFPQALRANQAAGYTGYVLLCDTCMAELRGLMATYFEGFELETKGVPYGNISGGHGNIV